MGLEESAKELAGRRAAAYVEGVSVDGADPKPNLLKGGGGAHTREKIVRGD